jgi:5-methyltetrahydropteroyltriglutamate--homocysteine methyltransferase
MHRNTDRILTTHPGRLPNPANHAQVIAAKNSSDEATFRAQAKSGIVQMIERQKQLGIDIMSDGEFWKGRDQKYYDSRVTGIKSAPLQPGQAPSLTFQLRERHSDEFRSFFDAFDKVGNAPLPGVINPPASQRWAIVDEVKAAGDAAIKGEIELVKSAIEAAGESVDNFFFPVLGPGWLDHFVFNDYYKTEEEYIYALALVAKADFKAVADAGFILQIDDPGLVDTWAMLDPAPSVEDYRARVALRIEATNWALEGIPEEGVRFHTCWGSWHTPHVTDLPLKHTVDIMLQVNASAYSIEAADVQHELDYQVWEETKFPDGKVFIPGVIAHKTSTVEPPELVAHRIKQYARIMGRENVIAGVDCGVGGRCYPDIGWAKLKALAEGAALASKELWPR